MPPTACGHGREYGCAKNHHEIANSGNDAVSENANTKESVASASDGDAIDSRWM